MLAASLAAAAAAAGSLDDAGQIDAGIERDEYQLLDQLVLVEEEIGDRRDEGTVDCSAHRPAPKIPWRPVPLLDRLVLAKKGAHSPPAVGQGLRPRPDPADGVAERVDAGADQPAQHEAGPGRLLRPLRQILYDFLEVQRLPNCVQERIALRIRDPGLELVEVHDVQGEEQHERDGSDHGRKQSP
jgi:hypothetical protein